MPKPSFLQSLAPVPAAKRPTNQDIDLAPAAGAPTDPRLGHAPEQPVGVYDSRRAKRVLTAQRTVSGRR